MTPTVNEDGNPAAFAFWLRFWRRVIAGLQIVGGLCGVYLVAFGNLVGSSRVILLLAFVLFVAGIWGGILLMLGRRNGVTVSLVVQALQLVQVVLPNFLYSFLCGLQIIIGAYQTDAGTSIGLSYFFGSRFFVFVNPALWVAPPGAYTGLNVTAALAILCLLYVRAEERKTAIPLRPAPGGHVQGQEQIWPPEPKP